MFLLVYLSLLLLHNPPYLQFLRLSSYFEQLCDGVDKPLEVMVTHLLNFSVMVADSYVQLLHEQAMFLTIVHRPAEVEREDNGYIAKILNITTKLQRLLDQEEIQLFWGVISSFSLLFNKVSNSNESKLKNFRFWTENVTLSFRKIKMSFQSKDWQCGKNL